MRRQELPNFLTTVGTPSTDNWQQIGARVVGSSILAISVMVLALDTHNLM